jgi:voltage-gated potassium channel
LSQTEVVVDGPLAAVIPMAEPLARFGGVLLAFPLSIAAFGLRRRKRIAWLLAAAVLPVLLLLPFLTGRPTEIPLLMLVIVTYPLLLWNRGEFRDTLDLSSLQIASLSAIIGVGLYGTIGAYGLREQFLELNTWGDAFYYVIVTIATVGYGDITPVTAEAKLFSLSVILFGTGAFTIAVGALIGPAIESRMAAAFGTMTASELSLLEDHVVVLGYGDVTESFLDRFGDEADIVVITPDSTDTSELTDRGVEVLTDDPTDEKALEDARVDDARAVAAAGDDDAANVLAVLAARNVNPDVRIVALTNSETHVEKLRAVGADEIVDLRAVGGQLLGASVFEREPDLSGSTAATETAAGDATDATATEDATATDDATDATTPGTSADSDQNDREAEATEKRDGPETKVGSEADE